ncbi:14109_t:CDS:2 [Ambispora leptoticha]|uniref:14109_t:CDS:1 n=1 Tax=Ambispora leptoticha TaxID=144679 RepID=A0A9N9FUS5_9GLOM|nr:14109_t:CDS:2 [Ambispora leptoticha]
MDANLFRSKFKEQTDWRRVAECTNVKDKLKNGGTPVHEHSSNGSDNKFTNDTSSNKFANKSSNDDSSNGFDNKSIDDASSNESANKSSNDDSSNGFDNKSTDDASSNESANKSSNDDSSNGFDNRSTNDSEKSFQTTKLSDEVSNDNAKSDREDFVAEFHSKFSRIVDREEEDNFITKLYRNKMSIIPWPVFNETSFYTTFKQLKLDEQDSKYKNAKSFVEKIKGRDDGNSIPDPEIALSDIFEDTDEPIKLMHDTGLVLLKDELRNFFEANIQNRDQSSDSQWFDRLAIFCEFIVDRQEDATHDCLTDHQCHSVCQFQEMHVDDEIMPNVQNLVDMKDVTLVRQIIHVERLAYIVGKEIVNQNAQRILVMKL